MSDNLLHITNGDCAITTMRKAGLAGEFLPWRDVLHEGPVPTGINWPELNKIRAKFISDQHWAEYEPTVDWFTYRDSLFDLMSTYDEVILWFEHDLYDQLQLIQIFAYLADKNIALNNISLICVNDYLGPMPEKQLSALISNKQPLQNRHIQTGIKAWQAFSNFDPIQIYNLLVKDLSALPYLKPALLRLLQQYPSERNGLNRTEQQILAALQSGATTPGEIFGYNQQADEVVFMGDSTFWWYMQALSSNEEPLLETDAGLAFKLPTSFDEQQLFNQQALRLTPMGERVLCNEADWLSLYDIDRWYGGVHIYTDNIWRWSDETRSLCR